MTDDLKANTTVYLTGGLIFLCLDTYEELCGAFGDGDEGTGTVLGDDGAGLVPLRVLQANPSTDQMEARRMSVSTLHVQAFVARHGMPLGPVDQFSADFQHSPAQ